MQYLRAKYGRFCVDKYRVIAVLAACICLTMYTGCAGSIGPVRLKDTAEANYVSGVRAFKAKSYDKAIRYFEYLRSKFPFSKYASLAELRIADSYFQNNEFGSAADAYKIFMRFHPNHVRSLDGYAAFQSARSQFKQIPGDFFILPPSYEKDQKSVGVAAQELRSFVGTYPNSQYYQKGYKLLQKCLKRRIDHELYVANYYLKRKKMTSAILRYQNVIRSFPEAEDKPRYVAELAALYEKNGEPQKAIALRLASKKPAAATEVIAEDREVDIPAAAMTPIASDIIPEAKQIPMPTNTQPEKQQKDSESPDTE